MTPRRSKRPGWAFYVRVAIVAAVAFAIGIAPSLDREPQRAWSFGDVLRHVDAGRVERVHLRQQDNTLEVTLRHGAEVTVGFVDAYGERLTEHLLSADRDGRIESFEVSGRKSNGWLTVLTYALPFLLFLAVFLFVMRRMQGTSNQVTRMRRARTRLHTTDSPQVEFADVAGADEAVEELHEI